MASSFASASSQYISGGTANPVGATSDWTVMLRANTTGTADKVFIGKRDSFAIGGNQFTVGTGLGGNNLTWSKDASYLACNEAFTAGSWISLFLACDSSGIFCLLNGAVVTRNQGGAVTDDWRTGSNTGQAFAIGRLAEGGGSAYMNGALAEIALWNVKISVVEGTAYHNGWSPLLIRPNKLVFYAPLVRNIFDWKGTALTNSGSTVVAHPRVIYPRRRSLSVPTAAAVTAVGPLTRGGRLLHGSLIHGGRLAA